MYIGVDIGGTKTLVASLDDNGVITEKVKFPTPEHYHDFLTNLKEIKESLKTKEYKAGCVAVPGKVERDKGIGKNFGNLTWHNVPIQADLEKIMHCPILIENDANLGGLSESMLLPKDRFVLYLTISTGIGTGFIANQQIASDLADSEGGQMLLEYHNRRIAWEDFASGRAIVHRFGKKASEIKDEKTWGRIAHDLAAGIIELMAIGQPDIIVIGGSVGYYLEKFESYLIKELKSHHNPLIKLPIIQRAARPEEAVIYGCYDLAKSRYGTSN